MNRYKKTFANLKEKGEKALIPFTVVGDPDYGTSLELVKAMIDGGADILELGAAFSDPIADGTTIQAADARVLSNSIHIDDFFSFIADIRAYSMTIPIGALIYANLIYQRGIDAFYQKAKEAGLDSVLVADLPIEEAKPFIRAAKKSRLQSVFIVSPLTDDTRLPAILKQTTGFVYVVARLGVTGAQEEMQGATISLVKRLRAKTDLPLCVGFGISTPEHVRAVCSAGADGAIVGSAIVKRIEQSLSTKGAIPQMVRAFVAELKGAARG
ncbi:MAG TPA: tryptophan synthase subunit alpha [Deltaproteobacteria bacterium]|nr:tryptophan synthase subunit alpha [Deltaproteobacteria bacterium]